MTHDEPNRLAFISGYYDTTQEMPPAKDLSLGCELVTAEPRVAIDCGCGAGRDTAFLREKGFHVHAFNVEAEAIRRCRVRFAEDEGVELRQASFESFDYPRADLVSASGGWSEPEIRSSYASTWSWRTSCHWSLAA